MSSKWARSLTSKISFSVLGQNDTGQNGTDKMVRTKWYGQNGTDKMVRINGIDKITNQPIPLSLTIWLFSSIHFRFNRSTCVYYLLVTFGYYKSMELNLIINYSKNCYHFVQFITEIYIAPLKGYYSKAVLFYPIPFCSHIPFCMAYFNVQLMIISAVVKCSFQL